MMQDCKVNYGSREQPMNNSHRVIDLNKSSGRVIGLERLSGGYRLP